MFSLPRHPLPRSDEGIGFRTQRSQARSQHLNLETHSLFAHGFAVLTWRGVPHPGPKSYSGRAEPGEIYTPETPLR